MLKTGNPEFPYFSIYFGHVSDVGGLHKNTTGTTGFTFDSFSQLLQVACPGAKADAIFKATDAPN